METLFQQTVRLLAEGKLPVHCCSSRPTENGPTLQEIAKAFPGMAKKAKNKMRAIVLTTALLGFLSPMICIMFFLSSSYNLIERAMIGSLLSIMIGGLVTLCAFIYGVGTIYDPGTPINDYEVALKRIERALSNTINKLGLARSQFEGVGFDTMAKCASMVLTNRASVIVRLEKDSELHRIQAKTNQHQAERTTFGELYDDLALLGFVEGGYGAYFAAVADSTEVSDL